MSEHEDMSCLSMADSEAEQELHTQWCRVQYSGDNQESHGAINKSQARATGISIAGPHMTALPQFRPKC
jgi:hypothetical protein